MHRRLEPADVGIGRLFWLISDAVVVGDAETGRIELWNTGAKELFGYTEAEAIGMPIVELVAPELRDRHVAGLRRYLATGEIAVAPHGRSVELQAIHRSGHRVWVSLTLAPLPTPGRSLVIACLRDVTERRAATEAVAEANGALRHFIAVAAHDLRGPLATLNASLEMLAMRREDVPADLAVMIDIAARQGRGAMELVIELLDLAQLDAGVMAVRPECVDTEDAVRATVDLVGDDATTVHIAADAGVVHCDPTHLRRILMNLVANAHRHGAPPVSVVAIGEADTVAIRVLDSGPGVAASVLPSLFDPYVRDERGQGTGLGLAIARRLARLNGGDVEYAQTGQRGTAFTLTLPRAAAD